MIWHKLSEEERRAVIKCLVELGYTVGDIARAAGVDKSAVSVWLSGRAAPLPEKLERLYYAMPDAVERCLPEPPLTQVEVDLAVATVHKALRSKTWRDYVLKKLTAILPGGFKPEVAFRVEREDIELFKKIAQSEVSKDQANKYVRYLLKFLDKVGWVLTPATINKVYEAETPRIARDTAMALKRFIKTVVKPRDPDVASLLYSSFRIPRTQSKNGAARLPTLEEVRRVWEEAARISPCAAAIWGIMAETGVRLDHLLRATLSQLQLDRKRLLLNEVGRKKRQPLVFLSDGAVKYLRDVYLPWREKFVKSLGLNTDRLFPCDELTIYNKLKEARTSAGLPWLEPRLLRKFHAQWLLDHGVDVVDIAVLQGRALPGGVGVTLEHYIYDYERRLRDVFNKHAPKVFPLDNS